MKKHGQNNIYSLIIFIYIPCVCTWRHMYKCIEKTLEVTHQTVTVVTMEEVLWLGMRKKEGKNDFFILAIILYCIIT